MSEERYEILVSIFRRCIINGVIDLHTYVDKNNEYVYRLTDDEYYKGIDLTENEYNVLKEIGEQYEI